MAKLTKKEREWVEKLQAVLNECPSNRLGFYTIGDPDVTIFDARKQAKLDDPKYSDFCLAVAARDAHLGRLIFPAAVLSTAG